MLASASRLTPRTLPVLDIVQIYHLSSLSLKVRESDLAAVDYIKLTRTDQGKEEVAYYYYNGTYVMTSADVAEISITMDALLTAGGLGKLRELGGIIVRSNVENHVGPLEDRDYDLVDPLLSCTLTRSRTLIALCTNTRSGQTIYDSIKYYKSNGEQVKWYQTGPPYEFYGSSYDKELGDVKSATAPVKVEFSESNGEYTFSENFNQTKYSIGKPRTGHTEFFSLDSEWGLEWPGVTFYNSDILKTAQTLYSFGISNPIIYAYQIPSAFIFNTKMNGSAYGGVIGFLGKAVLEKPITDFIEDTNRSDSLGGGTTYLDGFAPIVKKVIVNSTFEVRIHSMGTGQMAEANPAMLTEVRDGSYYVGVDIVVDPTPGGAPYYRLRTRQRVFKGDDKVDNTNINGTLFSWLQGAIRGANWQPAPVTFMNYNSQNEINAAAVRNSFAAMSNTFSKNTKSKIFSQDLTDYSEQYGATELFSIGDMHVPWISRNTANKVIDGVENAVGALFSAATGNMTQAYAQGSQAAIGTTQSMLNTPLEKEQEYRKLIRTAYSNAGAQAQQAMTLAKEMSEFNAGHQVNEQETQYALTSGGQSTIGNGCVLEIVTPKLFDVKRMVQFIKQFGFPVHKPLTDISLKGLATSDQSIIFLKTSGCKLQRDNTTLNGDQTIPRSVMTAVEQAFDTGIRIWKRRPFYTAYNDILKA